jgi:multidrug transporter EmrE-like cation transporter
VAEIFGALSPRTVSFLTLLAAIAVNIVGETSLKRGMNEVGELRFNVPTLLRTATTPSVVVGFAFVFGAAVIWLRVISREPLSWAYPMLALGYLPLLLTSREVLGEHVSVQRWVGAAVVIVGVWLVFRS